MIVRNFFMTIIISRIFLICRYCGNGVPPKFTNFQTLFVVFNAAKASTGAKGFNANVILGRATCDNTICKNGGTCVATDNMVSCNCITGYSGYYCEQGTHMLQLNVISSYFTGRNIL